MRVILIRHGESVSNRDKKAHKHIADHAMPLSPDGVEQAREAGKFLVKYFSPYEFGVASYVIATGKIPGRLWVSPYDRTRQTADLIEEQIKTLTGAVFVGGRREHVNLAEQQFGLFDGMEDDELASEMPAEYAHYKKCEDYQGRFWARMPLGESRFDVAVRVHEAFGTFLRDQQRHNIDTIVVVSHGATIRAFIMQWLHLPYEWFEKEPNPNNCSIRLIEDHEDKGYIFNGFPSRRPTRG